MLRYSLIPGRSVSCGGLGFEEEDFGAFDPAFAEVHAEPAVGVLFVDAAAAAGTEFFEVVLGPGFAHVGGPDDAAFVGGGGGAVGGEEDAVLHEHVGGFEHGIEKEGVFGGVGDVRGGAGEDAAVVAIGDWRWRGRWRRRSSRVCRR